MVISMMLEGGVGSPVLDEVRGERYAKVWMMREGEWNTIKLR